MSDTYRPGQLYKGRDGDLLFAILPGDDIEFVTNRGTRVPLAEAERVYAPLTLLRPVGSEAPEPTATVPGRSTVDQMRDHFAELAVAIRDALTLPHPEPELKAMDSRFQLMTLGAACVRSALNPLTVPRLVDDLAVRFAFRELRDIPAKRPVDYATRDESSCVRGEHAKCAGCADCPQDCHSDHEGEQHRGRPGIPYAPKGQEEGNDHG